MPPVLGAALGAAVPFLAETTFLGTSLSGVLGNGLFAGGLFGIEKLLGKSKDEKKPEWKLAPGPIAFEPEIQEITARFYSYGRVRLGGAFAFREADGRTLGYGIVLNCWPIDSVEGYFVDDELLTLSTGPAMHQVVTGIGTYAVGVYDEGAGVYFPTSGLKWTAFIGYIWTALGPQPYVMGYGPAGFLEFRNATDAGFSSTLLQRYFGGYGYWSPDHKCRGLAMLYSRWQAFAVDSRTAHYPRLYPVHSTVMRGARVFDPRDGTQTYLSAGAYTRENPTWKYSANPALQVADFLTFPEGFGLAYDDIDWGAFTTAANDCDRVVDGFAGPEPFAQAHLTWSAEDSRRDVLNKLLAACDGQLLENADGKVALWIGKAETPTLTLTTADIASWETDELDGVYAEVNHVQATYLEPRSNFAKASAPDVMDPDAVALVGDRKSSLDLPTVHSFSQAFRLTHRGLRRQNPALRLTITGGPRLLLAHGERVIAIDYPEMGLVGTFRVRGLTAQNLANVTLRLDGLAADAYDDVVPTFDPVNPALSGQVTSTLPVPAQPVITSAVATVGGGTATITAAVAAPTGDTESIAKFRMRSVDPTTHAEIGGWTSFVTTLGQYSATSPVIKGPAGVTQAFEVQAFLVSPFAVFGPASASVFVSVTL